MKPMKRIAILQSNYIPWKGYFDIIHSVDEFILFDEVQYTTEDWRNRNRIKTPEGEVAWITIPVYRRNHLNQTISQVRIACPSWTKRHLDKLRHFYRDTPYFDEMEPFVRSLYDEATGKTFVSNINYGFIRTICVLLRIKTKLSWSTDYPGVGVGRKTERLISICKQAGADAYLSGPAARNYIDEAEFKKHGIRLDWMEYKYPEYPQGRGAFVHQVSILDLLFNTGPQADNYIWGIRERRVA